MLTRRLRIQLGIFAVVTLVAGTVMIFGYLKAPELLFGAGRYTVTVDLPSAAGLYKNANVTFRGTTVGRVESVDLSQTGVHAVLSLKSAVQIPSDLAAEVHSQSALGEQYVALLPRSGDAPFLKNGDVIPVDRSSVPPDIGNLLDTTNRGLGAIPRDNLKTAIDEAYVATGGLGPELRRLVRGSTQLAIDARANLDSLTTLIDQSPPVLDSQADTSAAIKAWATNLAAITEDLRANDAPLGRFLQRGPDVDQVRQVLDRLRPTLPIIAANLVSIGQVAVTYQPAIEQVLVLLPQGVANLQAGLVPNLNTKQDYRGMLLNFQMNINLPPPCTTGFLPPQQRRPPSEVDAPPRPAGDLYCRVPQDSPLDVRGARNYPCLSVPGKRAPTVKMCESDEQYRPLNDGFNWKGDANATLSGQDVPQLPSADSASAPDAPPPPPPIAAAEYDPATGNYIGPDGRLYNQSNLSRNAPANQTWQSMLIPPEG